MQGKSPREIDKDRSTIFIDGKEEISLRIEGKSGNVSAVREW